MKCGICSSERLSPLGDLEVTGGAQGTRLLVRFPRTRLFQLRPTFEAGRARICLDCGAVLPFVTESERRSLNAEISSLVPTPD
ncbi:hypothetical protein [Streptacidiphilus monticola]|uniref:Zinc-ribbon domain-containing protein n=1 Tax=Streptacidiphilus monticola TaxID=2161674 RepID=A0ABW1G6K3_9ACTN